MSGRPWVAGGAVLSAPGPDGEPVYRYTLDRWWQPGAPYVLWVLLNPSTADATTDDPTVLRCIERTRQLGYGGLRMVNLFAWRSSTPQALRTLDFDVAIGDPHNDAFIRAASAAAALTVVGWGRPKGVPTAWLDRREQAMSGLLDRPLCLGLTDGRPVHPKPQLRNQLPLDREPEPWPGPRRRRS